MVGNGTFPIQFTGIDITPERLDELHEDGTAETTEAELTIAWAATDTTAMARWELQWSPSST